MFKFYDLNKEICLTCHYFDTERKVEVIGRLTLIDHNGKLGKCKMYNNFQMQWINKAKCLSFCRYKRWYDLPDIS